MNCLEDPSIIVPEQIKPEYNLQENKFTFQMQVSNTHPHTIHFYISSTFGCCLSELTNLRQIQPNSTVSLQFKLKMTNLVGTGIQALAIYASNHQIFEEFPFNSGAVKRVRISFDENTKIDPAILNILKEEVGACLEAAQNYRDSGQFAQALNKEEEAYEIWRKSETVEALIKSRIAAKCYPEAIRDIESMLIHAVANPHYLLKKVRVVLLWKQEQVGTNEELFHFIKTTIDFLTDNQLFLSQKDQEALEQLEEGFRKFKITIKKQPSKQLKWILDKASNNFNGELSLSSFYSSRELFDKEMKSMFLQEEHEDGVTPEEVLDPINYCIMKKPFVLPSGNSVEEESIRGYFKTNGFKDPMSRSAVNPNLVFPNRAFERFISQHPRRKMWQMYEYDFINN